MQVEISNKRNEHGVKYSCDQYRTFNRHHYVCWMSFINDDLIKAYRAAGVRVRRIKEDLYVHRMDTDEAAKVDKSRNYQ